jgi:hypothetical protein
MIIIDFSQRLRALGQALELLNVDRFCMEPDGDDFLVRANAIVPVANSIEPPLEANILQHVWGGLPGQRSAQLALDLSVAAPIVTRLDLRYTSADIDRLDREGRARRMNPQRIADPGSLSQLLRTIGAYINRKPARLVKISQEGTSAIVDYQTFFGSRNREVLTAADLYDFWFEMYMRRENGKADWFHFLA